MPMVVKARNTASAYNILPKEPIQWCLEVLRRSRIMTDSQATDFVTFDFKGSRVCYFAVGSTDHRMNFLVHYVAK